MGVAVWAMVELEADDALASAARVAAADDARRAGLHLDAGQGPRAVRPRRPRRPGRPARRRRSATPRACARSSASTPSCIPDFLALVGDASDGYPGIAGIGRVGAARLLNQHGALEDFPPRCSAKTSSARCCSRSSPRSGRMRDCSRTSRSCAGVVLPMRLPRSRRKSATRDCSNVPFGLHARRTPCLDTCSNQPCPASREH